MQHVKLFSVIILSSFVLYSCSGNTNAGKENGSNASVTASGSGADTYLESTINTSAKSFSMNVLEKVYLSHSGKARVEMYKIIDGKPSLMMIGISDANNPAQTILIDDSAKTYSVNKIDTVNNGDNILDQHTKYKVTKIGNDNIQGLGCVHAQIIKTMNFSGIQSFMNGEDTTDVWMTKDIPMPAAMQRSFAKGMGLAYNSDVANQLVQIDCIGFPAKFLSHSKDAMVVSQLTKIAHDNFPAPMFEVPQGYKQTAGL